MRRMVAPAGGFGRPKTATCSPGMSSSRGSVRARLHERDQRADLADSLLSHLQRGPFASIESNHFLGVCGATRNDWSTQKLAAVYSREAKRICQSWRANQTVGGDFPDSGPCMSTSAIPGQTFDFRTNRAISWIARKLLIALWKPQQFAGRTKNPIAVIGAPHMSAFSVQKRTLSAFQPARPTPLTRP
jgi:hypothetical protein